MSMAEQSTSTPASPFGIREVTLLRDIETVKAGIEAKYGDRISDALARDIVRFVEEMTNVKGG